MTTPDYFSALFWRSTLNHIIFGAATNAVNAWILGGIGSVDTDTHLSIPGWGVAAAALAGAILAFLLSLLGQALPGTAPASFVPQVEAVGRRRPARKIPAKAPTAVSDKPAAKKTSAKQPRA
ncbi:hypothetical protein [Mycobacterium intracellulare]|uniref:hypothetical protein n=1 Tax=Mycobacterium intracellulare TaxID=1767 RepID=UPI00109E6192|nr:hypothetical protein [Mycobacterium intracellulare]